MMSHQHFETWLFEPSNLSMDQAEQLTQHLETCPTCRQTQAAWQGVQNMITKAQPVAPYAGFAMRWKNSLAERRIQEQRRQVKRLFIGLGGAFLLFLVLFSVQVLSVYSPIALFTNGLQVLAQAPLQLQNLSYIVTFWLGKIPPTLLVGIGIVLSGWVCLLFATWIMTLVKLNHQGVTEK